MSRDRSWNDGEKLSFSERDKLRREGPGGGDRPQGASQAREEHAKRHAKRTLDGLFSGGTERAKLERALADAHGGPGLADACRAYRDALGHPKSAKWIGMFLDSGDAELVAGSLTAALEACEAGGFEPTAGLRSQVRMLVDDRDGRIAGLAEDLLERL